MPCCVVTSHCGILQSQLLCNKCIVWTVIEMSCNFGTPIKFDLICKITCLLTFAVRFSLLLSENRYLCSAKYLHRLVSERCSTFFVHYRCLSAAFCPWPHSWAEILVQLVSLMCWRVCHVTIIQRLCVKWSLIFRLDCGCNKCFIRRLQ